MQREALPQLSTSKPSLFQIRMRTSAVSDVSQQDQLVAADAGVAVGDGAGPGLVDGDGASARIEHDKIIAEPVHLAERNGESLLSWLGLIW